jgi:hypothetical protein
MSFRLAADVIDKYAIASPSLRQAVCQAAVSAFLPNAEFLIKQLEDQMQFFKPVAWMESPMKATAQMDKCQTVWHGLLRHFGAHASDLRAALCDHIAPAASGEQLRAITGFFLTAVVTFGGLAYLCGLSHRAMRQKVKRSAENKIEITFIGNGGKYYEFLNPADPAGNAKDPALKTFIENLFREGDAAESSTLVTCEGVFRDAHGVQRPKAAIALGMLMGTHGGQEIEICNALGETQVTVGTMEFTSERSLGDFYAEIKQHKGPIVVSDNSAMSGFIAALDKFCPQGRLGTHVVIPGLGQNWARSLMSQLQPEFLANLRSRLTANAAMLETPGSDQPPASPSGASSSAADEPKVALEPVFIAERAALLVAIRDRYAKP